jgi:hypothetical protein
MNTGEKKSKLGDLRATTNGAVWRVEEYRRSWKWWRGWREWRAMKAGAEWGVMVPYFHSPDEVILFNFRERALREIKEILKDRARRKRQFYLPGKEPKTVPDMPGPTPPPPFPKTSMEEIIESAKQDLDARLDERALKILAGSRKKKTAKRNAKKQTKKHRAKT